MKPEDIQRFETAFQASLARTALEDDRAADAAIGEYTDTRAEDRLSDILMTTENTGISVTTLRELEAHFFLSSVLDPSDRLIAEVLCNISACTPNVMRPDGQKINSGPAVPDQQDQHIPAHLRSFDAGEWAEALQIGRALAQLRRFPCSNARTIAVAQAAERLLNMGFAFSVQAGRVVMPIGEIEKITSEIEKDIKIIGRVVFLSNLFRISQSLYKYDYDQILFGRTYS
jgi:hypothetical protein